MAKITETPDDNAYSSSVQKSTLLNEDKTVVSSSNPLPITSGFSIPAYDYVAITYPSTTTEVYVFKTGGSGGTTVSTITLTYTDATKENLSSVEKS